MNNAFALRLPICVRVGLAALAMLTLANCTPQGPQVPKWAAYYNWKDPEDAFKGYELLVVDSEWHPDVEKLKEKTDLVLGYISLGEVHDGPAHKALPAEAIISHNTTWNSYIVDVRHPAWQNYVVNQLVPWALEQKFDGVMLDTVDGVASLEKEHPEKYKGMKDAAASIIKQLRAKYPDMKIMLNRGFDVVPQVDTTIDFILAESVLTIHDMKAKKSVRVSDSIYNEYIQKIAEAKSHNPKLKIYTLDYWDMSDKEGIAAIRATHRAQGYIPYVTTPDLRTIHTDDDDTARSNAPRSKHRDSMKGDSDA